MLSQNKKEKSQKKTLAISSDKPKMAAVEPVMTDQPEETTTQNDKADIPTGKWSSGLLGCFGDIKSCLLGMFCSPILACKLSRKMNECCCAGCFGGSSLRTKYRIQHDIQGSVCSDALISCFCTPCALCQLSRDLNTR